jgi:hypothetical protein
MINFYPAAALPDRRFIQNNIIEPIPPGVMFFRPAVGAPEHLLHLVLKYHSIGFGVLLKKEFNVNWGKRVRTKQVHSQRKRRKWFWRADAV